MFFSAISETVRDKGFVATCNGPPTGNHLGFSDRAYFYRMTNYNQTFASDHLGLIDWLEYTTLPLRTLRAVFCTTLSTAFLFDQLITYPKLTTWSSAFHFQSTLNSVYIVSNDCPWWTRLCIGLPSRNCVWSNLPWKDLDADLGGSRPI